MSSKPLGILRKGDVYAGCGAEVASEEEYKLWQCLYPSYIDGSKSLKEGRRITSCKAVKEPVIADMVEVLHDLNIPYIVENKAYSRDFMVRGRIRVNLGNVTDESVNTKLKLMCRMAAEIPHLKSRIERLAKEAARIKAYETAAVSEASGQNSKKSKGKKGK